MNRTAIIKFKEIFKGEIAKGVEVGVAGGINAAHMLGYMPNLELYLVDPYKPYYSESESEKQPDFHEGKLKEAQDNVIGFFPRYTFIRMDSEEAARCFPDDHFDFVYIDGDHSREEARKDVVAWLPKVKKGGMLAGHDWWIVGTHISELLTNISHEDGKAGEACDWWVMKG